ncbi:MAG TPA: bifunctional (p)ppGpp synthetase/guanosine-3',5'-bis(diphosphate) 3'-pyrophosphohydrolase [Anaerolineae bacterium]|nr:bifunctional (p)ppGpp synthetase/guanosine-3',5'-bis(diphosphate) 3'-pyrophosphohydrolase [Anaerolineae bacterium]
MPETEPVDIETLIQKVNAYLPRSDGLLRRAYSLAAEAHGGQMRATGDPYVQHSLAAADILADMRLDPATIIATILHDVPEDTDIPLGRIQQEFGDEIAKLVDGVTKLSRIEWESLEEEEAESLRHMFLAMAEDIRVVLIKLADRLHNMRTLYALPPEKQRKIAQETLEIFAPLASRLGIWQMKWELEDLALRHLEPGTYREIASLLAERRAEREAYIARVIEILRQKLKEEGIEAEIIGRPKHIYSIYKKMERKGVDFDQIYDVRGLRIIVDQVQDCYAVLGIVHTLWRPIPGEFDDYIAAPKENLYRSLHTAVIGPEGKPLEIQIRTYEMHRVAEYGIAAHWRYKEQIKRDATLEEKIAWLRQLMEWRQELTDAREFVDSMKTDVFQDQVYVFTPKGDIIDLPAGATPIDFAYHIHTEIGHRCRGAKVNGRLVSLDYQLKTGDQVEILTAKQGGPSRDWLNPHLGYIKTSRARQKIRQWFRRQERSAMIAQGREVLDKELRRLGVEEKSYEEIAEIFKYDKVDDFLAAVGYGDITTQQIATKILELERVEEEDLGLPKVAPPPPPISGVTISGVGDLLTRVAGCCNPLPGDDVVGYITRGRGITLHRRDCPNILRLKERERLIEVNWGMDTYEVYPVMIRVLAYDRPGLVRDIADIVAAEGVNMSAASAITNKKDHTAIITATLEIRGVNQLSRILNKVDRLPNVLEVRRQVG